MPYHHQLRVKHRALFAFTFLCSAALLLPGCSDFKRTIGLEKSSPDEFAVESRAPLTMPPDFELRPPQPGAARPQEATPGQQARQLIEQALERNARIPFVGPQTIAFDKSSLDGMYELLLYAHRQHHCIVESIERGESARVEALMREHTNPVKDSLNFTSGRISRRPSNPGLMLVR